MRRGFTLIELMVASLLLGILVTILTMLFNSSSIAWRTGTAGVAKLQNVRRQLGIAHEIRDEVLPGLGSAAASGDNRSLTYRTVSILNDENGKVSVGTDTGRAYGPIVWDKVPTFNLADVKAGSSKTLSNGQMVGSGLFTVGVRSAGPDKEFGTGDDITTWPDEVY